MLRALSRRFINSCCSASHPCRQSAACALPTVPVPPAAAQLQSCLTHTKALPATGRVWYTVAAGTAALPAMSPAVQELWNQVVAKIQQAVDQGSKHYIITEPWNPYLAKLYDLDAFQPHLLAWHVLPWLRTHLDDVGGLVRGDRMVCMFFDRIIRLGDYSPLVWALGLQQPVAPATSSPLPPPPDPPLPTSTLHKLLIRTAKQLVEFNTQRTSLVQHVSFLQQLMEQVQQHQPAALQCTRLLPELWRLCNKAQMRNTFWRLVHTCPALQPGACAMAGWITAAEVAPVAEGLLQSGLLPRCTSGDIWWLVARLDNAAGDSGRVLEVFGLLALQAPHHPALKCLGDLLVQYIRNARQQASQQPGGAFFQQPKRMASWGQEISQWPEPTNAKVIRKEFLHAFRCSMSGAEVMEWVTRLQLVLPPQLTCDLLLQLLLQAPSKPRALLKADVLQLYDLLLQQLARPGWEPQQQAASMPPAAASALLRLLPDASKSPAAATKVLVVWRHMCGALDPAWCGGGLAAAAAMAAGQTVGKVALSQQQQQQQQQQQEEEEEEEEEGEEGEEDEQQAPVESGGTNPSSGSNQPVAAGSGVSANAGLQQLQQLSPKGQQQVMAALETLGLLAELHGLRGVVIT